MIQIEGLTPLQKDLATCMWKIGTMEELSAWLRIQPKSIRDQAVVVLHMIIAAELDQAVEHELNEANAVLSQFRK